MAELLIEHGADLYAKRLCADGYKTPLEMAKLPKSKFINRIFNNGRRY